MRAGLSRGPIGVAPEAGGGEAGDRAGGAHPSQFQPDPGAEAVAGDVEALDAAGGELARAARAASAAAVGSTSGGSDGRGAEAGQVEGDHLALGGEQRHHRVPDRLRGAEPVDQQQRLAVLARGTRAAARLAGAAAAPVPAHRAHRQCGFAKRTWTSPMRRSRKPASEELR